MALGIRTAIPEPLDMLIRQGIQSGPSPAIQTQAQTPISTEQDPNDSAPDKDGIPRFRDGLIDFAKAMAPTLIGGGIGALAGGGQGALLGAQAGSQFQAGQLEQEGRNREATRLQQVTDADVAQQAIDNQLRQEKQLLDREKFTNEVALAEQERIDKQAELSTASKKQMRNDVRTLITGKLYNKAKTVANSLGDNELIADIQSIQDKANRDSLKALSEDAEGMRKEFTGLSKNFIESRDAFKRVVASSKDPSPAGDLALIFNYMKVLDPGSVVRESEFAQAAATGSFGQRIQAAVARVEEGKRLSDGQRQDFVNRAGVLFQEQRNGQGLLTKEFTRIANLQGTDPAQVIIDFISGEGDLPSETTTRALSTTENAELKALNAKARASGGELSQKDFDRFEELKALGGL